MKKRSVLGVVGVSVGFSALVLLFQNCSNKNNIDLEKAKAYAQDRTQSSKSPEPTDPVLLTLALSPSGSNINEFSAGQTIYATSLNAGSGGRICIEKDSDRTCITNYPTTNWKDLYSAGWSLDVPSKKWTTSYSVGTDFTAGNYRIYITRPNSSDPSSASKANWATLSFSVK